MIETTKSKFILLSPQDYVREGVSESADHTDRHCEQVEGCLHSVVGAVILRPELCDSVAPQSDFLTNRQAVFFPSGN